MFQTESPKCLLLILLIFIFLFFFLFSFFLWILFYFLCVTGFQLLLLLFLFFFSKLKFNSLAATFNFCFIFFLIFIYKFYYFIFIISIYNLFICLFFSFWYLRLINCCEMSESRLPPTKIEWLGDMGGLVIILVLRNVLISKYVLIYFLFFWESASLRIWNDNSRILYGGSSSTWLGYQSSFQPYSTISLELNIQTKTLHFFVDDTQLSHCITNIYTTPLSFGISTYCTGYSSIEIISFLLLRKASVDNNIMCAEYEWKTGCYDKKK
jgi:hypothetical protein